MKVGPATSQIVTPPRSGQGVQSDSQEVKNQQSRRQPVGEQQQSSPSEKFNCHNSKSTMSTEDFLQLHNSSTEEMLDTVKDVMALKVMEKTLDVIDKIVSD